MAGLKVRAGGLLWGQVCLFGGLLTCIAIRPEGLRVNDGVSYFGTLRQTFVPYVIGLLGSALVTRRAIRAETTDQPECRRFRRMADLFAWLTLGVVLTPYTVSALFDVAHTTLATALFVAQLILGLQLVRGAPGDRTNLALLLTQLAGGIVAAIYVLPVHGFLIQGQLVFQAAFGALLIRTISTRQPEPVTADA
jgi:hypothetical protein